MLQLNFLGLESKNVSPVAGGKKVKSQGRSRDERGVGLMGEGGGQSQWSKQK